MPLKTVPRKRKPRRKKAAAASRGLTPQAVVEASPETSDLAAQIRADGGEVIGAYRDPLGGHGVLMAALPIEKVEPTPYQRDISEPHVKRLASAMERVDRFLDPLIAVRQEGRYWTPNGNHRLHAAKLLGAKSVVALVLPDPNVAFQILALNTEKAHNLRERSLEVIRMFQGLAATREVTEASLAHLFEEPAFITLGCCYDQRPRFSGGAYHSVVRRIDTFLDEPLLGAMAVRDARAEQVLALDDAVNAAIARLKDKGLESPYLRSFVVARINFLRFVKTTPEFEPTIEKLTDAAKRFNVDRVRREDLARSGGPLDEA
ncbi:MAG: ParB/RepB/Spo0J family partition protein [Myxococcaceae bacterium]